LQSFIRDLHWPDPEFAEHLNQRLKMMACDMIDSCIKRTDTSFQNHLRKGILLNPTDYIIPTEICAMVNVVIDAKNQSFKLCAVDGVDVVSFREEKWRSGKKFWDFPPIVFLETVVFWAKLMIFQKGKPKEDAKEKKVLKLSPNINNKMPDFFDKNLFIYYLTIFHFSRT
jgi:hypothetical protein